MTFHSVSPMPSGQTLIEGQGIFFVQRVGNVRKKLLGMVDSSPWLKSKRLDLFQDDMWVSKFFDLFQDDLWVSKSLALMCMQFAWEGQRTCGFPKLLLWCACNLHGKSKELHGGINKNSRILVQRVATARKVSKICLPLKLWDWVQVWKGFQVCFVCLHSRTHVFIMPRCLAW